MELHQSFGISGRFRFKTENLDTGEVKYTPWHRNLIVTANNHGMNLIMRSLGNLSPLPLAITKAKIGTGVTAAAVTDTNLQTPTIDNIEIANVTLSTNTTLLIEFFMPNALTPDDDYTEFGVFCGDQLFSRAIISPTFEKVGNVNTTVEYEYTIANV
jgi:hypothetical protein